MLPIHDLRVPKGCSTVCRRTSMASGIGSRRACIWSAHLRAARRGRSRFILAPARGAERGICLAGALPSAYTFDSRTYTTSRVCGLRPWSDGYGLPAGRCRASPVRLRRSTSRATPGLGIFFTTAVSFFLVETGDKTQFATAALSARVYYDLVVAAGTTTGMKLANTPAVCVASKITQILPISALRVAAAVVYLGLSVWGNASTLDGSVKQPPTYSHP